MGPRHPCSWVLARMHRPWLPCGRTSWTVDFHSQHRVFPIPDAWSSDKPQPPHHTGPFSEALSARSGLGSLEAPDVRDRPVPSWHYHFTH